MLLFNVTRLKVWFNYYFNYKQLQEQLVPNKEVMSLKVNNSSVDVQRQQCRS